MSRPDLYDGAPTQGDPQGVISKDEPRVPDNEPSPSPPGQEAQQGPQNGPRRRRRMRRLIIALLLAPFVLAIVLLIVGQTPAVRVLVEPILESQLGVDVRTGSVRLSPNGKIVLTDALVLTDTIDNRAGVLIEVEKAVINVNWLGVLRGSGQVSSIVIDRPLVRVSQDVDTGRLNLAAMKLAQNNSGGATPAIEIHNGILQIGEHDATDHRALKEFSMQGRITEQDAQGVSVFEFAALPTEAGITDSSVRVRGALGLTGTISANGIVGTVDGVRLEDWSPAYIPTRSRAMYERLALAGGLAPTRFNITSDGQVEVILTLDGVSLNLPIDDTGSITGPGDLLRMRQTRGVIRFGSFGLRGELKGLIDELGYDVELDYKGLDTQSPFDATLVTSFRLDDQFRPAKFLPQNVISKLDRFEHPVADVRARVNVSREQGGGIRVSGTAQLSNGSAVYKQFRYPFSGLEGEIEFDPERLIVRQITGVGPSGASLRADGLFSPLGEESVVTLNLKVDQVPIDDHLLRALDEDQRDLLSALFNEDDYDQLIAEGLLLTKAQGLELRQSRRGLWERLDGWRDGIDGSERQRAELAQRIQALDQRLSVPEFDFGGKANVDVVLRRHPERPEDNRWTTDVHVRLPEGGLVPGDFPLPIVARDVEIMINEDRVELTGGRYTGLQGGWAQVSALVDRSQRGGKPLVRITAREIPIDERLVAAIPGYYDQQSDDPDDISLRRILDRLRLSGLVECEAVIGPRGDGRLGYDVEATITQGAARPAYLADELRGNDELALPLGSDPLSLDQLYGTIYVTEEMIIVDLDGALSSPQQPLAPTPIQVLTQLTLPTKQRGLGGVRRVSGLLPTDFGPPAPGPQLFAIARADGIDLAMPLQHAVAVVSPRIARDLLGYKEKYSPDGVLAINAQLEGVVGGAVDSRFTLDRIEHLSLDFDGSRYRLGPSWGRAEFSLAQNPEISFDGFQVGIEANGDDAGTLSLNGDLPLARRGRLLELSEPSSLRITYENGAIDSPLTRVIIDRFASSRNQSWFSTHKVDGRFDLDVTLAPEMGAHRAKAGPRGELASITMLPTQIHGQLKPRSLELTIDDEVARFSEVEGVISFNGYEGAFEQIRVQDQRTSLALDGTWAMPRAQGLSLDLRVDARGDLLEGPVRAVLPDTIDGVVDDLEIRSQGDVILQDMAVTARGMGTADAMFTVAGGARINDGSAVIGLPITGLAGDLSFSVRSDKQGLGYELLLDASRLRAGLMRVFDAQVQIIGDANNAGVVLIPEIVAGMHGGRIAGSAQIRPGAGDATPHYWMDLHASGVRAAPVFDDLLLPPEGLEGPPIQGQDSVLSAWSKGEDLSRGALIADLTLTGPIGEPGKRVGRGLVRISGGSVVALPGLINLIEASNLSLPTGATIDLAEAAFYVDGPTLAFEQLSASSRNIEIMGYGTMDWATRDLDLRFRSRAIKPIPVISKLVEKLRDELITTRVTGAPGDLRYSVQQFGATKRLISALVGNPETDQERRMREVERQVLTSKHETTRATETDAVMPAVGSSMGDWDWGAGPERPENPGRQGENGDSSGAR